MQCSCWRVTDLIDVTVAAVVLLLYDYCLTFGREVSGNLRT